MDGVSAEAQIAMLLSAITGLATAIGILWRSLEKRTETQITALTEAIKTVASLQGQVQALEQRMVGLAGDLATSLDHLASDQDQTRSNVQRHHTEHGAILHEIRATIVERQRLGQDALDGDKSQELLHTRGEGE